MNDTTSPRSDGPRTRRLLTTACEWAARTSLWLVLAVGGLGGCAGARAVDAIDLDVARQSQRATARLATPNEAAAGHLELAWLCLLHGHRCERLQRHAEAAVVGAGDMALAQLTRALARQATSDVSVRATAWLDLTLWAQRGGDLRAAGGADLITLALQALGRLALRDRAGVRRALRRHVLSAADLNHEAARAASVAARLRRAGSLASWLPAADAAALGRPPQVATIDARPFGRRLYADLDRVRPGAALGPVVALARAAPASQVAPASFGAPAPPNGAPHVSPLAALHLPLPGQPGVYRVRLRWQGVSAKAWTVAVRAGQPLRVWVEDSAAPTPPGAGDVAQPGHTWLRSLAATTSQPRGATVGRTITCTIALPLAAEGERLAVALLPTDRARTAQPPGSSLGARSRVPSSLTTRIAGLVAAAVLQDGGGSRLATRYPRGPLASLLALSRTSAGPALGVALDRTLDQLPNHVDARLDRARLARNQSQIGLARRLLEPLARRARRDRALARRSDLHLEVASLRQLDGLGDLAVAAAERAVARQPGDCVTYWHAVEIASDALDRDALRRLVAVPAAASCRASAPLKLAALLASAGQTQAALTLLRATSQRSGWGRRARSRARAMAPGLGARWAWQGASAGARAARAAAEALVQGRTVMARAAWTRILLGPGATPTQRRGAWLLGARAPWSGLTEDGVSWVKAHAAAPAKGAAVTWLLDHEIVVPLPGGGALRRVHQIVRVHTAGAAESVGELNVPPNAELVMARTHTADGRVVSPADTPNKESFSLREVTPGAAVEYVQVQFLGASDPATGATRLPLFLLQSRDGPVVVSRFEVLDRVSPRVQVAAADGPAPALTSAATRHAAVKGQPTLRVDASPSAPSPTVRRHGAWRVRRWQLNNASRFRLEPRANRAAWHLSAVRASASATLESVVGPWADVLAAQAARRSPALRPWLARAKRAGADRARWAALIAAVAARVADKRSGLAPGSPAAAVRRGEGDRASLLLRLARSAGVKACLVRVQPWSRQPSYGAPDPADYSLSALQLWLGTGADLRPVWIDPGVDGALLDYLRAGLRRRPALRIGCDPGLPARLTTPDLGAAADRREVSIQLVWQADGAVDAEVQDTLRGALALIVRNVLRTGSKDQRIAVLRQLSSATFPGMTPTWIGATGLEVAGSHKLGGAGIRPLTLRYRVHGAAASHRTTRLQLGLVPYRLGRRYATLDRRKMTLRFGHQLDVVVTLEVRSAGGRLLLPAAAAGSHALVKLAQTAEQKGGRVQISHKLQTQMGLVSPADYVAFARALRTVDRAERLILRRSPVTASTAR